MPSRMLSFKMLPFSYASAHRIPLTSLDTIAICVTGRRLLRHMYAVQTPTLVSVRSLSPSPYLFLPPPTLCAYVCRQEYTRALYVSTPYCNMYSARPRVSKLPGSGNTPSLH